MNISKRYRYLLSILSGIIMVLAFPFTGSLTPLVFVAWIPLLFIEGFVFSKNYRSGKVLIHALITFFIFNTGTSWWIWNASAEGSIMAILVNTFFMSGVFYLFHLTKKFVGSKQGYLGLFFYWMGFEYVHYHWEIAWPWLSLGNYFSITPSWIQWYSYSGVTGGSLWILIVNLMFYRVLSNVYLKKETWRIQTPLIWLSGIFLLLPLTISLIMYFNYSESNKSVEVVVVQNNVDPYSEKFGISNMTHFDNMMKMVKPHVTESTDLILMPETSLSQTFDEDRFNQTQLKNFIINWKEQLGGTELCFGSFTMKRYETSQSLVSRESTDGNGFYEVYNSSIFTNASGNTKFIHKSKLVPGVEHIPFANTLPFINDLAVDLGGPLGSLGVENEPKIFHANGYKFAPVVCYESVFGEHVAVQCRKGAELICIITNDGWWGNTAGHKQHQSFARLRAIENRRSVARSANTGISSFINQRGDVIQVTEWWKPAVIKQTLNLNSEVTFYTTYGDVLGRMSAFVFVLLVLYTLVSWFKKRFIAKN